MRRVGWARALRLGGSACALLLAGASAQAIKPVPSDWRKVATAADATRLREWRDAWIAGLAQARAAGHDGAIRAAGVLLDPDRALDGQAIPPPGDYRCRTIRLGQTDAALPAYVAGASFTCRVDREGAQASLYQRGGLQRPVGLIFDGDAGRGVFLGTLMLGDETRAIDYGRDAARNMAGRVERIGDARWRMVLPHPGYGATIEVVELVPVRK